MNDSTWLLVIFVFIKFKKSVYPFALSIGKAIQYSQIFIFSQRAEFFQQISRRSIKTHVYKGLFLGLGNLEKIH